MRENVIIFQGCLVQDYLRAVISSQVALQPHSRDDSVDFINQA